MREQAALGQLEVIGQPTDGQAFEANTPREIDRVVDDGVAGFLSFAHGQPS